mgnify:CR=1 FL=1
MESLWGGVQIGFGNAAGSCGIAAVFMPLLLLHRGS